MRILLSLIAMNSLLACGQRQAENRQPPCSTTEDCRAFGAEYANHVCSVENRCVVDRCGDGIVQAGEQCDDGNALDTDACTATCKNAVCSDGFTHSGVEECDDADLDNTNGCTNHCALPSCGDGFAQPGEECDDGNELAADDCTNQCFHASCGDGVRRRFTLAEESPRELLPEDEGYEACDDGNLVDTDACSSACRLAACGDGFVYSGNEECDDANDISGDGCSQDCNSEVCGNGRIDAGESCDDGNRIDTDDCTNACAPAGCGDGVTSEREECDDGNLVGGDDCSSTCLVENCGNGRVDPEAGEQCDDGNADSTDACTATCRRAVCGDGNHQLGVEECDDGNLDLTDSCVSNCRLARCGDGHQQAGIEACDDGNLSNADACLSDCRAAACGDGFIRQGLGEGDPGYEACDDANKNNTDSCTDLCVAARCGDGNLHLGVEECDDGNGANDDACIENCIGASCGDGFTRAGVEDCDDGDDIDTDACTSICQAAACGDGHVRQGLDEDDPGFEQCDDGNLIDSDNCTTSCLSARCGDSIIQLGEECDDGNNIDTDDCTASCRVASCGDGFIQAGRGEACDDANLNNFDACTISCQYAACGDGYRRVDLAPGAPGYEFCDDGNQNNTDSCVANCVSAGCQDGYVQVGVEECDDGNNVSTDSCTAACLSAGCGDRYIQPSNGEECDDGNLTNTDACTASCQTAVCGDGIQRQDIAQGAQGYEACDDGNSDNTDACVGSCAVPVCGDGFVKVGEEQCDDGNEVQTDDCTNRCTVARCGDGHLQAGNGEFCDDGNTQRRDECTNTCRVASCGDGIRRLDLNQGQEDYEACDDGNGDSSDACTIECKSPICGDGFHQPAAGESCDDGNTDETDACLSDCSRSRCGDGEVRAGVEACDDGNRDDDDVCTNFCSAARCGDRILRHDLVDLGDSQFEECDDGNLDNSDGCTNSCRHPIKDMALGEFHTCAIRYDDRVACFGSNGFRQAGLSANVIGDMVEPTLIQLVDGGNQSAPLGDTVSLSASRERSCAILRNGGVACWGRGGNGLLGRVNDSTRAGAKLILGFSAVAELVMGSNHSCAIGNAGTVWCWGSNANNQMGDSRYDTNNDGNPDTSCPQGDPSNSSVVFTPRITRTLGVLQGRENMPSIAAGADRTCAVIHGRVWCWGDAGGKLRGAFVGATTSANGESTTVRAECPSIVPDIDEALSVAVSSASSCARVADGSVTCWGYNKNGELGRGATQGSYFGPAAVSNLEDTNSITAGYWHYCALLSDRSVACWGANAHGQLGDGTRVSRNLPTVVPGLADVRVLRAAGNRTCAISLSGKMRCWGQATMGQNGDGRVISVKMPQDIPGTDNATQLVSGESHLCAAISDSVVRCWGDNDNGQLGDGSVSPSSVPLTVGGVLWNDYGGTPQLAAGGRSSAASTAFGGNDRTSSWGGFLSANTIAAPYGAEWVGATNLAFGRQHGCFIRSGVISCWGSNYYGQFGNSSFINSVLPTAITPPNTVPVALHVAANHTWTTCGVFARNGEASGYAHCWGKNENNLFGRTLASDKYSTPVYVSGASLVTQVAVGSHNACAIRSNGGLYCWGNDSVAPVGDGDEVAHTGRREVMTQLENQTVPLSGVVEVGVGYKYICARTSSGHAYCWGANSDGTVGAVPNNKTYFATRIKTLDDEHRLSDLSDVDKLAIGSSHACALVSPNGNSKVMCWGTDGYGQLGRLDNPPFDNVPRTVMPLYDSRVFARSITTDGSSYNQGGEVVVTGLGFTSFVTVTVTVKLNLNNENAFAVDTLQVARDGKLRSVFSLANNLPVGEYTVRVSEVGGNNESDGVIITVNSASRVVGALPASISGEINPGGDVDWYQYTPGQNVSIRFETSGSTDTFCALYRGPILLGRDDDAGSGTNCRIDKELQSGQTYRMKVAHAAADGTGSYTFSLTAQ
jgi:cysteine-rich repeat protein